MSWLKRIEKITLCQGRECPFLILKEGVYLCCDNFYKEEEKINDNHIIIFKTNKNKISRKSTFFYRFKKFPIIIPFQDIIQLDNVISDGKITKKMSYPIGHPVKMALVMQSFIQDMDDEQFDELIEEIAEYDSSFLLSGNEIDDRARSLHTVLDLVEIIYHKDWYRTLISIADSICLRKDRGYCWTASIPELEITCYGVHDTQEAEHVNDALEKIGIQSFNVRWC